MKSLIESFDLSSRRSRLRKAFVYSMTLSLFVLGSFVQANAQQTEKEIYTDISNVEYTKLTDGEFTFEFVTFTASKNGEEPQTHKIYFKGPRAHRDLQEGEKRLLIGAAKKHTTDEGEKKRKPSWELERIEARIVKDPYGDVPFLDDVVPIIPAPAPQMDYLIEEIGELLM